MVQQALSTHLAGNVKAVSEEDAEAIGFIASRTLEAAKRLDAQLLDAHNAGPEASR